MHAAGSAPSEFCPRLGKHTVRSWVSPGFSPYTSESCVNRKYNRLNEDYRLLHSLFRFFLENTGPSHEVGDHTMLPFLVDMASLFELFVAKWLQAHPVEGIQTRAQERMLIGENEDLEFRIDLLVTDSAKGNVLAVADTKCKVPDSPDNDNLRH